MTFRVARAIVFGLAKARTDATGLRRLTARCGSLLDRSPRTLSHLSTVEVWHVELERDAALVRRLGALLSEEERARAARLRRPGHAERWTVARAALRILLGSRLGCAPDEVAFTVNEHGKPRVPRTRLRFNLSHSGGIAVVALADDLEIGVDVERPGRNAAAVARTLSDGERATGDDLLQIWCRKEAWAKAVGGGLGWAPERFDTTRVDGYALADLALEHGYVGALAVQGERADHSLRRLSLVAG